MGDTKEKEHIMGFESESITSPSRDKRFGRGYGPIARETTPRISISIVQYIGNLEAHTRNVRWVCLRTGCWGEYLGLRRTG